MATGIEWITKVACHWPRVTLWLVFASTIGCSLFAWQTLSIKTNRSDLINPDAPYQKRWNAYAKTFGDVTEDLVVVVEADDRRAIIKAVNDLGPRVERETDFFKNVLYRIDLRPLAAKGLQFLSTEELQKLVTKLRRFRLMNVMLPETQADRRRDESDATAVELADLSKQIDQLIAAWKNLASMPAEQRTMIEQQTLALIEAVAQPHSTDPAVTPPAYPAEGDPERRPLQQSERYLLNDAGSMGFLQAQPVVAPGDLNGATEAVSKMRELIAVVQKRHPDARIGLTGVPVLEHDEMKQSQAEMSEASVFSFVGVALVLFAGFRRLRHPVLGMLMLVAGTAWAFAAAAIVVGHLNILSIAFAAMLFGLGNDFAIVYLSHYSDLRERGTPLYAAILETSRSVGPGITTAACTAAAAFFAAVLTDFSGIAELGLIAGCGIVLCNILTFVFIPPALVVWDRSWDLEPQPPREFRASSRWWNVVGLAGFLIAFGVIARHAPDVRYETNLLEMQAEGTDANLVQKRIEEKSAGSLLYAVSMAPDRKTALERKTAFEALPAVGHVEEIASMFPTESTPERQDMMAMILRALGQLGASATKAPDPSAIGQDLDELHALMARSKSPEITVAAVRLDRFLDELSTKALPEQIRQLSGGMTAMSPEMANLANPKAMEPVSDQDISPAFFSRYVSGDGKWLLKVFPKEAVWDEKPLEQFVTQVRSVDAEATGTPFQNFEASRAIWNSYLEAGGYALVAVLILLWWDFRTIHESLIALLPAACGLVATLGILGWANVPLNQANMIMLPLLLGLGVDGGVHVLHDYRSQTGGYRITASCVRSIVLTGATSIVGFGSLMVASHRGLFSLGLVLTVGVTGAMVTALVAIPSLLSMLTPPGSQRSPADPAESPVDVRPEPLLQHRELPAA
jgi:hopanoid biosynthesis associated RND transporter like protein HpnN